MKTTTKTQTNKLLNKSNNLDYSFAPEFLDIIQYHTENYDNERTFKESLKLFLEDMQKGGCINGMIGEFIYHTDCKDFYIKHIDSLEDFKSNLQIDLGDIEIKNTNNLPHYTFIVWLCFEEFCYDLYNNVFEN